MPTRLCSLVALYIEHYPSGVNGLRPMQLLSEVQFVDVKTIQVEFLERIIDKHGNGFDFEQWIAVLEMVRAACLVKNVGGVGGLSGGVDEVLKSGLLQWKFEIAITGHHVTRVGVLLGSIFNA